MSTFRDAIANAVVRGFYAMSGGDPTELAESDISPNSGDLTLADAVLAMPEMEAIRKVLKAVGDMGIGVVDDEFVMTTLYELPESVDAWVLRGDQ